METGGSTTVLFVDDEPLELELCADFFGSVGDIRPIAAESAEEALETLASTHIDCLVSDGIRTEDGQSFVTVAKESYPDLRTVLYSGSDRDALPVERVERYLQKGANMSLDTLAATIRDVTTNSRKLDADGDENEWSVLGNFSWTPKTDVGSVVVRTLANQTDRDVLDFPPLYDVVDSDALSQLVAGTSERDTGRSVRIQFSYDDFHLRITSDGVVTCRSALAGR